MAMDFNKFGKVLSWGYLFALMIAIGSILLISIYDYVLIPLDTIAGALETSGVMTASYRNIITSFIPSVKTFIPMIDFIFLIGMIAIVGNLFVSSYNAKRIGYFSLFGFLSFGIMIFMFIASIFESVTNYFYHIFFEIILVNVIDQYVFFTFYIQHFATINILIVVISLFLNFIDLNFAEFFARKTKENTVNLDEQEL